MRYSESQVNRVINYIKHCCWVMEDEDRELIIMFSKNVELYNLVKSSFSKEVEAPD